MNVGHQIQPGSTSQSPRLKQILVYWLTIATLAMVYFVAGKFGLSLASQNPSVSPVWAPTGIALAAVLVLGYRAWPGILLGAFLTNISTAGTPATSLAIAVGNTLEALMGGFLVNQFAGGRAAFDKPQGIFKFVVFAGLIATAVSATVGVTSLALAGFASWTSYASIWLEWWLGDMVGALVVAPVLAIPRRPEDRPWNRNKVLEAFLLVACLYLTAAGVFGGWFFAGTSYPLEYLTLPIVLWAAIRFSQRDAALATLLLSAIANRGTLQGVGPFVQPSQDLSLLLLQVFTAVVALMAITVGSVILERKRAARILQDREQALEQNQKVVQHEREQLNAILQATAEGVMAQLPTGQWLFANDQAAELCGFPSAEALMQASVAEVLERFEIADETGQPLPLTALPARQAFQGQQPPATILRTRQKGSEVERWSMVRANPVFDAQGNVSFAVSVFQDISALKQAEHKLREEQERLRVTLSSIGDAVIASNLEGRVIFMNPVAQQLTGWTEAEAFNKDLKEVFHILNEETREEVESPVTIVLREGKIVGLANHTILMTRDGREIPIDDSGAPIRNESGELIGVILVFRDVTERREVERKLTAAFARIQELYSLSRRIDTLQTPSDILETILTSQFLASAGRASIMWFSDPWEENRPEYGDIIAGWRRDLSFSDPTGLRFQLEHSTLTPEGRNHPEVVKDVTVDPRIIEQHKEYLTKAGVRSYITFPLLAGGKWHGVLSVQWREPQPANVEETRYIQGLVDQAAVAIYSLRLLETEQEARKAAETANRLKMQFLAMVSHELRTPLTSIHGFATSLLASDVSWEPAQQQEFIEIISQESENLGELVEQLLDLSRLQAGTFSVVVQQQSLFAVMKELVPQLQSTCKQHALSIEIADDLPPVSIDTRRIHQVVCNLVENATKYSPIGSRVRISALPQENVVILSVSDEGPGIPLEERQTVFEAFRQASNRAPQDTRGAGLGLAIAKGLVEAHGGQIWVDSQPSRGTTVSFSLPITA